MNRKHIKPSFFILGVQKGGTSTLHEYLSKSEEIFFPFKKELHFFDAYYHMGMDWYYDKFIVPDNTEFKHAGEATPYYFFHPYISKRIHKEFPKAKFILLFRNPVDRAFSHYNMSVRRDLEKRSFEEAILHEFKTLKLQRLKMFWNRKFNLKHVEHSYLSRGFYAKQLKRWFKLFPKESFLFFKSEDFFQNPQNCIDEICSFLNIKHFEISPGITANSGNYTEHLSSETIQKLQNLYMDEVEALERMTNKKFRWFEP